MGSLADVVSSVNSYEFTGGRVHVNEIGETASRR